MLWNRSASNQPRPKPDASTATWIEPTPKKHSTMPTNRITQPDM